MQRELRALEWLVDLLRPYNLKGKNRLLLSLVPRTGEVQAELFGYRVELDLSDWVQRCAYLGIYEPQETRLVRDYLQPGMYVVDVGAHCGYYSLLAASIVGPSGKVDAFEPQSYCVARLRRTIKNNDINNVEVHPWGLSDHCGEMPLYTLPEATNNNRTGTMVPHGSENSVMVGVRTLDSVAPSLRTIDLLKIDVDGSEPRVLAGAKQLLAARRVRAILCEFSDFWLRVAGTSPQRLYDHVLSLGFEDADGHAAFRADCMLNRIFMLQ